MRKNDIIIISIALVLAIASIIIGIFVFKDNANTVIIKQNNEIVYQGSIKTDKIIELSTNKIVIENGEVYMESASCKNQICVNHSSISKAKESIACLPNKVLVEVR